MKSKAIQLFVVLVSMASLASCTATYQQLLEDRDLKIRDLNMQNSELAATNRDLESRALGDQQRITTLESQLAQKPEPSADSGIDKLREELPGVDVRVSGNRISLGINNQVTFGAGSTRLKNSAGGILQSVAGVLKRDFPGRQIVVAGHTDTDPLKRTKKLYRHNRHLSVERADVVAQYLIDKCGVEESMVVVAGFGPHRPIEDGASKIAKAANRRVEIVVTGGL